jgi:hypothetical protein
VELVFEAPDRSEVALSEIATQPSCPFKNIEDAFRELEVNVFSVHEQNQVIDVDGHSVLDTVNTEFVEQRPVICSPEQTVQHLHDEPSAMADARSRHFVQQDPHACHGKKRGDPAEP